MEFEITLADNGYILKSNDLLLVYKCKDPSLEIPEEICAELLHHINQGTAGKFNIKIEVTPIQED